MSSMHSCSPTNKYSVLPTTIHERPSITITSSTVSNPSKCAPSEYAFKAQKSIQLKSIASPEESRKFSFPTTNNPTKITQKSPPKKRKQCKKFALCTTPKLPKTPKDILLFRGYKKQKKIAPTLQGEVFIALKTTSHRDILLIYGYIRELVPNTIDPGIICNICYQYTNEPDVIIKSANKQLHRQRITVTETGIKMKVKEDIVKEARLMKMFMNYNAPQTMIKYYDFIQDKDNYYLVMERGGKGLFEFVVECHKFINDGKLSLKEWKRTVHSIFIKMVSVLNWMHNVVRCCNMDISLENVVMAKDTYFDEKTGKIKNLDIRFIDFGLTEIFDKTNTNFICDKFVGKTGYKAPKVYKMKRFCANKSDIWSLGVCLFMMSIGAPPYQRPTAQDLGFRVIKNKQMIALLKNWNRLNYIGKHQYDLLMKLLCIDENKRLSIDEIMKHRWIRSYFQNENKLTHKVKKYKIKTVDTSRCDTVSLHRMSVEHKDKSHPKKILRSPSIIESETNVIQIGDNCAALDDDDDDK